MGSVFFIVLLPLFLVFFAVKYLGPVIGALGIAGVVASIIVLVVAARSLLRARRRWVRVVGRVLLALSIIGIPVCAAVAVLAFGAVAYLNSFG